MSECTQGKRTDSASGHRLAQCNGDGSKLHLLQDMSSSPGNSHEDSEGEGGGEEGDPHKCHSWGSQCRQDWRKILALVCLWMAYLLCNVAYSMISPFFPQVVSSTI